MPVSFRLRRAIGILYKSVFIRPIRVIGGPSSQEPSMTSDKLIHGELTEKIIRAYYQVYNSLGYGFLEKVYENALAFTLRKDGILVNTQVPINVYFEEQHVGIYFADLIVANCVIIEAKAAVRLCSAHEAQLLNYLKATSIEVGLLLNFGEKPEFRRKIFSNDKKHHVSNA
jgi:GxxExxY protein